MIVHQIALAELANRLNTDYVGDPQRVVDHVAPLHDADARALSFCIGARFRGALRTTGAGIVILPPELVDDCPTAALISPTPEVAYATAAQWLHPRAGRPVGVSPRASVDPEARLGEGVAIAAGAIVEAGASLAAGVELGPGAVVEAGAEVGADSVIGSNAVVGRCVRVGARAVIHGGAVLGADGFGFAQSTSGWEKIPQLGSVIVGDDVEIGANTTIDRGTFHDTIIGDGVKIDNLVQIGHNVRIGKHSLICGSAGVAGSAVIGENCVIGGAAMIAGHIELADGVTVMGGTGVSGSLNEPGAYCSITPVAPVRRWRRNAARFNQLDDLFQRLKALEAKILGRKDDPADR